MRICYIVEAGAAGVGNVVLDLVRKGIETGNDITVIYGTSRTWTSFVESLNALSIKTIACPMRREVGLHDARDAFALYGALRKSGPYDIIHAHSSKAGALTRLLRPFFSQSVFLYTPHAFVTMATDASPVYAWIEWLLSWFCNAIICVSEQEKRHAAQRLKIAERKLHVIPNGIDLNYPSDRQTARAQMGVRDDDFVIGFVGRLEPQKNPVRAVEAFALAAMKNPALRFVIVGYGTLREETEKAIAARGSKSRASFTQNYNGRSLMGGFDCLLCSSDYESYGLVIIEALAAGVPVVSTPVGIADEAVIPGLTGKVTDGFTAQALADGLNEMAGRGDVERVQCAAAAKARAQNYSLERMSSATNALYAALLAQKSEGARLAAGEVIE